MLWMNAFGGTAVSQYVDRGHLDVIAAVQAQQPEIALFALLETLPLANVTSFIGLVAAQAATLAAGLPLALVLVALCYSTWKGLRASTAGRAS